MNTCTFLAECNQKAKKESAKFKEDFSKEIVGDYEFQRIKHKYPYYGFVPCKIKDYTFSIFSANDDVVAWHYFWLGADSYEPEVLDVWINYAKKAKRILDIGAYTGLMSIVAALCNEDTEIIAFEPMARSVERCWINIKINGLANRVKVHNLAASDAKGRDKILLYRDENFLGTGNSLDPKEGKEVKGEVSIYKDSIDNLGIKDVDLVKIDTEGHELKVLQGAIKMLTESKPTLIVEVWNHNRDEVFNLLDGLGYKSKQLGGMDWLFYQ